MTLATDADDVADNVADAGGVLGGLTHGDGGVGKPGGVGCSRRGKETKPLGASGVTAVTAVTAHPRDPRDVHDGESRAEIAAAEKGGAVAGRDECIAERVERGVVAVRQSSDNVRRAAHDAPHAARESPRRRLGSGEREWNERGVGRDDAHLLRV